MQELENLELYNDDCFNVFPKIKNDTVNLFVLDLPYNQTACKWDQDIIPLDKMWDSIKRIMKPNGIVIMFCTAKFGYRLIHSNPKWFRYDLIWKKSRKVGFLSANKMPLRQHENIYIFGNQNEYDENNEQLKFDKNKIVVDYSKKVFEYIGKTKKQIIKDIPHADHFFRWSRGNFNLPTEATYANIIALYQIDDMPEYLPYETLKEMWDGKKETDTLKTTYNPQKTEGTPYKTVEASLTNSYYRGGAKEYKTKPTENKGDRHPSSIIDHENLYVFSNDVNENYNDLEISRNKDLRQYAQNVKDYIGKSLKQIDKDIGNQGLHHFYCITSSQFWIPNETTYNKLIDLYKLDEMPEFIPYETLKGMWEKPPPKIETTYNPQKTEGTPYKTVEASLTNSYYRGGAKEYKTKPTENKGDRHPISLIDYDGDSILIYKNPHKTIHRTQKPVELCEWLIKTYSNEKDTVMDFTMGSGTVAIGCLNTNRKFIGVEKDKEIYEKAQDRIAEHIIN